MRATVAAAQRRIDRAFARARRRARPAARRRARLRTRCCGPASSARPGGVAAARWPQDRRSAFTATTTSRRCCGRSRTSSSSTSKATRRARSRSAGARRRRSSTWRRMVRSFGYVAGDRPDGVHAAAPEPGRGALGGGVGTVDGGDVSSALPRDARPVAAAAGSRGRGGADRSVHQPSRRGRTARGAAEPARMGAHSACRVPGTQASGSEPDPPTRNGVDNARTRFDHETRPSGWRPSLGAWSRSRRAVPGVGARQPVGRSGRCRATRRRRPMERDASGYWELEAADVRAGDRYAYRLDGSRIAAGSRVALPAGGRARSVAGDRSARVRVDRRGVDRRVARAPDHLRAARRYLLACGHVRGAAAKLDEVARLGVTAIEIMPVAEFPGGATGATTASDLFAPSRAYGTPDELRAWSTRRTRWDSPSSSTSSTTTSGLRAPT